MIGIATALRPLQTVGLALAMALTLAACSKCDMAGWLNSCGDKTPKLLDARPR